MRLFQRDSTSTNEINAVDYKNQKIILTIGGMTATEDSPAAPASMLGSYKAFSDQLLSSAQMVLSSDFVGKPEQKASGFAKIAEELLGGKKIHENNIQLLGVSTKSVESNINNMFMANKFSDFQTDESMQLAAKVILPLISNNGEAKQTALGWNITGDRLPADEAKARLNNLTIFAQSNGTSIAKMTENSMQYQMEQLGYSSKERTELTSQITLFGTGNVAKTSTEPLKPASFTSILMESETDKVIKILNEFKRPVTLENNDLKISKISNGLLISVKTPPYLILPDTQTGEPVKFDDNAAHHVWQYTKRNLESSPNNDVNAKLSENILANMVERELNFDVNTFTSPPKSKLNSFEKPKSETFAQKIINEAQESFLAR